MLELLRNDIKKALRDLFVTYIFDANTINFNVTVSTNPEHGDFSSNVAFILASKVKEKPGVIAEILKEGIRSTYIKKIEVAGKGFLNFFVSPLLFHNFLKKIIVDDILPASNIGCGLKVQVEFVSANPTGPLHVGHGRGASFGDTISRVLKATGFNVEKEYYLNDRGTQINNLGASIYYWYMDYYSEKIDFPLDGYKGEYIKVIAEKLAIERGDSLLSMDSNEALSLCKEFGKISILEDIKKDLKNFNVDFDSYFSEYSLYEKNAVQQTLDILKSKGYAYNEDNALWFKSTAFGDDKDRVLIKSTGEYTYFASDIAYHRDKFERGYDRLIDIWGADHHGYVKRLKSAINALGYDENKLVVILIQMVSLKQGGKKISMSTRQNEFIPLSWLIDEVGKDAARFFYVLRSCDTHFDFDIDLAKEKSTDNPVYYVQYAYVRVKSLLEKAKEKGINFQLGENIELLLLEEEIKLIKKIYDFENTLKQAALNFEPSRIASYLIELSSLYHNYYYNYKIIDDENKLLTNARLNLSFALSKIIVKALGLLGADAPERM
jgi:arginyl-tRNA synthetase